MEYRNLDDVRNQLLAAGLVLDSVTKANGGVDVGGIYVESVRSVRCDVSGEKKKKTGSYWLHELRLNDGIWITGAYWLDHGNSKGVIELRKTCAKCGGDMPLKATVCPAAGCGSKKAKSREIPPEQIEAHKKRLAEARRLAEAESERDADRAAAWANAVWLRCREIFSPDEHEYLTRKKLKSAHGTRVFESNDGIVLDGAEKDDYEYLAQFHGALVVPMCDAQGRRRGLQFILSREKHKALIARLERDKQTWPGGVMNPGLHCVIGGAMRGVGLVAEGFATAASLAEASNLPVACAFTANRLAPVAESLWKAAKKRLNLLIAGDDDWLQRCVACKKVTPVASECCAHCNSPHGKENAGVRYAQEAARTVSGAWFKPAFSVARPTDKKGPTDFNDLRCIEGPDAVRAQVEAKLAELGWQSAPGARAGVSPSAGGGGSPPRGSGGGGDAADDKGTRKERRRAAAVLLLDDAVERFIPLDDGTGKHVFDTWTNKIAMREQMLALLPAGMGSNDIKRHPLWIDRGAFYLDQVGFDPSGRDGAVKLNTWQGWPMVPKEGKCDLLLELLDYFCSGEGNARELSQWVLRWMAYPLQHPGAKMASAIIMHGPQGTGKSTVFQTLAKIYGDYSTVLNQRGLEDKFNSDWSDSKLFILAEEVVTRAEMWHIKNELKELVTGDTIRINPKNIAAYRQRNQVNIAYLSNENQPLPLDNDDRRHCVIWTPPPVGEEFYDEVNIELENGGVAAFYHYLMTLDLGDFHPKKRPPMTDAKRNLILLSLPSEHRFVNDWIAGDTEWPVCPCLASDLYAAYMRWCRNNGEQRPRASNHFHGFVGRLPGWEKKKCRVYRDSSYLDEPVGKPMVIPPKDALEAAGTGMPPGASCNRWLTDCHVKFAESMKGREDRWAA